MLKKRKIKEIILPNKKINFFITTIIILGILSGSIFLMILNKTDKTSTTEAILNFFTNIKKGKIESGLAFKNSLIINYIFIFTIWILGFSIIGVIINIFITYIKGFLTGFSISAIFLTFKIKGIIASILYLFTCQLLNIIIVTIIAIYSLMFTTNLIKIIYTKKRNHPLMLKKYFIIFMFAIITSFISSLIEAYLFPNILKLLINIYIK